MSQPHSEAAADFDADGKVDLAVVRYGSDDIAILRGNGGGGFSAPTFVPVGDGPLGLRVGDLNRDRRLDIAVVNAEAHSLSVLLGDGAGHFAAAGAPIPLADAPWYVVLGDVNHDQRLDAVVTHVGSGGAQFVPSRDVSILLGNGHGGFAQAAGSPLTVGRTPYGVEMADFNGDDHADLAIANQFDNFVSVLFGDGTGQFVPASTIVVGNGPSWLAAADFDDDGVSDLAVAAGSGRIAILRGDGAGNFAHAPGSPIAFPGTPHNLRAADFDLDGELDLGVDRVGGPNLNPPIPPNFSVLLGDGHGGFQLPVSPYPLGSGPLSMAVGDFNGDRKPDVAIGIHFADTVSVLLNQTVTPAETISALRQEVLAAGLSNGLRTSLSAKLGVAERAAGVLDNGPACAALAAFVAGVQANTGSGGLTPSLAQAWIDDADAVRADLGCVG